MRVFSDLSDVKISACPSSDWPCMRHSVHGDLPGLADNQSSTQKNVLEALHTFGPSENVPASYSKFRTNII